MLKKFVTLLLALEYGRTQMTKNILFEEDSASHEKTPIGWVPRKNSFPTTTITATRERSDILGKSQTFREKKDLNSAQRNVFGHKPVYDETFF